MTIDILRTAIHFDACARPLSDTTEWLKLSSYLKERTTDREVFHLFSRSAHNYNRAAVDKQWGRAAVGKYAQSDPWFIRFCSDHGIKPIKSHFNAVSEPQRISVAPTPQKAKIEPEMREYAFTLDDVATAESNDSELRRFINSLFVEYAAARTSRYEYDSTMCAELLDSVRRSLHEYHLGAEPHRRKPGKVAAVFWYATYAGGQLDIAMKKYVAYHDDGHRDKDIQIMTDNKWHCLFGEHLLFHRKYSDYPVAIVESEKTAIICAIYLPQFVWLATGGKQFISKAAERLTSLYPDLDRRQVYVLPDNDPDADDKKNIWFEVVERMKKRGHKWSIPHDLIKRFGLKGDIADDIVRQVRESISAPLNADLSAMIQKNPLVAKVCDMFAKLDYKIVR